MRSNLVELRKQAATRMGKEWSASLAVRVKTVVSCESRLLRLKSQ